MLPFMAFLLAFQAISATPPYLTTRQTNCSELELVIARGTGEPNAITDGHFGIIVGDPLYNATKLLIPGTTGYAVNYPASGACDSGPRGITDTVNHFKSASASCPDQKFVLVGYSQGADVVHYAAAQISPSLYPAIIALVQFGDPTARASGLYDPNFNGQNPPSLPSVLAQRQKENCALGDPVCTNNGSDFTKHLTYNSHGTTFMNNSALYIQKQFQTNGQAGPDDVVKSPSGSQTEANAAFLRPLSQSLANCNRTTPANETTTSTSVAANLGSTTGAGCVVEFIRV